MVTTSTTELIETEFRAEIFERLFGAETADCWFLLHDVTTNSSKQYAAHKTVLSTMSPVFATDFEKTRDESPCVIKIQDVCYEPFVQFIHSFYTDKLTLSMDNVNDMWYLAAKYNVTKLIVRCEAFITCRLCAENALIFYQLSSAVFSSAICERSDVEAKCLRLFADEFDEIMSSESFKQCSRATLAAFLRALPRYAQAEKVFDACIDWSKKSCQYKEIDATCMQNLRAELGKCFDLIPFSGMEFSSLINRYKSYESLFTKDEIVDIFIKLNESRQDLYRLEPVNKRKIRFNGKSVNVIVEAAMQGFCFKVAKPLILYGVTLSRTVQDGCAIDFTANIQVFKKDETIFDATNQFDAAKRQYIFPRRINIAPNVIYAISIDRNVLTPLIDVYKYERQISRGVWLIPIKYDGTTESIESILCGIESIQFLLFDDVNSEQVQVMSPKISSWKQS